MRGGSTPGGSRVQRGHSPRHRGQSTDNRQTIVVLSDVQRHHSPPSFGYRKNPASLSRPSSFFTEGSVRWNKGTR